MKDTSSLFTIIVPTFNHEATLEYSLGSILNQTLTDFQVHVIGDGAGARTREIVTALSKKDPRIHYHHHPKSPRTGEIYRAQLLTTITSPYICYLSDDDLWFPNHLEKMASMLTTADFGYTFPLMIQPNGKVGTWYGDLTQPFYKKLFLDRHNHKYNVIPLSCAGHTLEAYRRLPSGWETTPAGTHTDLYMWQKFVAYPGIQIATLPQPTVLHLASSLRQHLTATQRVTELKKWTHRMETDPYLREELVTQALTTVYQDFLHFRASLHSKWGWQMYDRARNLFKSVRNFLGVNR